MWGGEQDAERKLMPTLPQPLMHPPPLPTEIETTATKLSANIMGFEHTQVMAAAVF